MGTIYTSRSHMTVPTVVGIRKLVLVNRYPYYDDSSLAIGILVMDTGDEVRSSRGRHSFTCYQRKFPKQLRNLYDFLGGKFFLVNDNTDNNKF